MYLIHIGNGVPVWAYRGEDEIMTEGIAGHMELSLWHQHLEV